MELARRLKAGAAPEQAAVLRNRILTMVFFNPSLRTRTSFESAMLRYGGHAICLSVGGDTWKLEYRDGAVMDGEAAEHIKEAAPVLSRYGDLLAVRTFAGMKDPAEDAADPVLRAFARYATVPVINMESAAEHPCQGLADWMTMDEKLGGARGRRFVLTWAPQAKGLPMAVPHSAVLAAAAAGMHVTVAHPPGYDLNAAILEQAQNWCRAAGTELVVTQDQRPACRAADALYVKSWGSPACYGHPDAQQRELPAVRGLDGRHGSSRVAQHSTALSAGAAEPGDRGCGPRRSALRRRGSGGESDVDSGGDPEPPIAHAVSGTQARRVMHLQTNLKALRTAVPYLRAYRGRVFTVKLSGAVCEPGRFLDNVVEQLALLYQLGIKLVVVHGGGEQANALSQRLGTKLEVFAGRRITDTATLEVVKMAFAGTVNTNLVAAFRKADVPAVGLSGIDGGLLTAMKRPVQSVCDPATGETREIDFGHVGDIVSVSANLLKHLLDGDYVPVICSLAADAAGGVLNVNADTVAAHVALALQAAKYFLITNVDGVLRDPRSRNAAVLPRPRPTRRADS